MPSLRVSGVGWVKIYEAIAGTGVVKNKVKSVQARSGFSNSDFLFLIEMIVVAIMLVNHTAGIHRIINANPTPLPPG
jgi:hypothetical protein